MAILSGASARLGDRRFTADASTSAADVVADASFDGGYAVKVVTGDTSNVIAQLRMAAMFDSPGALTGGLVVRGYCDFKAVTITASITYNIPLAVLDAQTVINNTNNYLVTGGGVYCAIVLLTTDGSSNSAIGVQVQTGSGTILASASLYTLPQNTFVKLELEATQIDATHLGLTLYANGVKQGSQQSFATAVTNNITFQRWAVGDLQNLSLGKGASCDLRWANIVASDNSGAAPLSGLASQWGLNGPHAAVRLPNADFGGAEDDWTGNPTGSPNKYQNWDEAISTWAPNAGTYNICPTSTGAKKQGSTLPATTITDVIIGSGVYTSADTTTQFPNAQLGLDDGTESLKTNYVGTGTNGDRAMQFWQTSPSGAAWSPAELNLIHVKAVEPNSATEQARVNTLWVLDWYYNAPFIPPAVSVPIFEKTSVVAY